MTRVAIERLTKRFDDTLAVDALDLEIGDHEFVSLLGPSGCGKTTTLRCIAGFEEPTSGRIAFDGVDVVDRFPEERNIGMVFQNYALFPHMTVRENLAFGLEMRGVASAEIERRTRRALEVVQLGDFGHRYPRQLSGGQQQRVALARAIVIEPAILLLDEPLANLDAKLREEMRFFIRGLQQEVGITTVYVTHDQGEAMVMSDRIVVMFEGVADQIGPPQEIYNRPATRRVASFIGQSNFVAAEVVAREDPDHVRLTTPLGPMRARFSGETPPGAKFDLVLRPEAVAVTDDAGGDNTFRGRLEERYFLGNQLACRLRTEDGELMSLVAPPWLAAEVGAELVGHFAADRTWLVAR